jgi:hypothetical protein
MATQDFTTTEAATRLNVADVTVRLWCRQGRFPNARAVPTPRGSIWYIPESDLRNFVKPMAGRPPKAKTGTASGQDGRVVVTKKRGAKK